MINIFKENYVRGRAIDYVSEEVMTNIGKVLGTLRSSIVIVGMDTRESSPILKAALIKGLEEAQFKIYDLNITSTPAIMTLTKLYNCIGVMVTSGHTPFYENGLKIFKCGEIISNEEFQNIKNSLGQTFKVVPETLPVFSFYDYLKYTKGYKLNLTNEEPVIFDFANGSLSFLGPEILENYNFKKKIVNSTFNGKNTNFNCGDRELESIYSYCKKFDAKIGFAYDSDGDSFIAVERNSKGEYVLYDGYALSYVMAIYYLNNKMLKYDSVVCSLNANPGLIKSLEEAGANVIKVDPKKEKLQKVMEDNVASLGIEVSGHIFDNNSSTICDALLNSLRILEILNKTNKTLEELVKGLKIYKILTENLYFYNEKTILSKEFDTFIENLKKSIDTPYNFIIVRNHQNEHRLTIHVSTGDDDIDKEILKEIKEEVA